MQSPRSPHFVFVHGASHGAWCWYKVRCLLEKAGCRVTCLDMASAGIHPSDPNTVLAFDEYNKPLTDFMAALPLHQKVILVGHSLGGLNVTDAMNKFVEKVEMAVYVNAAMFTMKDYDDRGEYYRQAFQFWYGLGPDKPATSGLMREEYHRKLMYNTSPEEDAILAAMLLRPCPSMATASANIQVGDGLDQVKRVCIWGTSDAFLKLDKFEAMIERWPPTQVLTIDSDHSPFFSAPQQLFNVLLQLTSPTSM